MYEYEEELKSISAEQSEQQKDSKTKRTVLWSLVFVILFGAVMFNVSVVQSRMRTFEPTKKHVLSKENRELLNGRVFHTPTPTPRPTPVPTKKPQQYTTYSYTKPKSSKNKQTYFSFPDDDEYYMDEDEWLTWHGDEYKSEEDALDMYYWLYG